MRDRVETALDEIRSFLQADGGDVELIDVNDDVVVVRLTGACQGCPMASMTMQNVIKQAVKKQMPEVKEVVAI